CSRQAGALDKDRYAQAAHALVCRRAAVHPRGTPEERGAWAITLVNDPTATRVLLIDDEPSLRQPLADDLARQGIAVRQAEDAAKGRAALIEETPDLVLLDIMMPGEDGLSLCRHLSEAKNIPVILLTARGEATDRIVGLEIGADDYVVKPFEPRELVA